MTVRGGSMGIMTSGFASVNLSVLDSVISENASGIFFGTDFASDTLAASRSLFLNNSYAAIQVGGHTNDSITNSTFVGGGYGVLVSGAVSVMTVTDSTFANQTNDAMLNGIMASQSSITVGGTLVDGTGCAAIGPKWMAATTSNIRTICAIA